MEISIKINTGEDIRLRVRHSKQEADDIYLLESPDDGKAYLTLKLEESGFMILGKDSSVDEEEELLRSKLDELLVELNPNEAVLGIEDSESSAEVAEDDPYDPEKIRVEPKQFSLRQIYDMIKMGDIDLTPDFQRHLVWDAKRKSRLIESVLLRIPLPMFYFAEDEDGLISVVDGLQRLSTIREFMDNKLKLRGLEYLEDRCGGRYYSDENGKSAIDKKYFRWFNMTQITVNVIDSSSPTKLKYDIFRRINTGGKPLNSQEIRNCLASLNLRKALKGMVALPSFSLATGGSVKDVRMDGQELAMRFILFQRKYQQDNELQNYSGNIESELNSLTEVLSRDKKATFEIEIASFDQAMQNAHHLFGKYTFRKCLPEHLLPAARKQQINKALFVSWSVLLSQYDPKVIKQFEIGCLASPLAEMLNNNAELLQLLTYGTNAKVNTIAAFKAAKEIISENLSL